MKLYLKTKIIMVHLCKNSNYYFSIVARAVTTED